MRTRAARVHDALGDALVVEVRDLLAQDEVFERLGPRTPAFSESRLFEIGMPWFDVSRRPAGVDPDAIERGVCGFSPGWWLARPRLGGFVRFGERAAAGERLGGVRQTPVCGWRAALAVLHRLQRVVRQGVRKRLGRNDLPRESIAGGRLVMRSVVGLP